MLDALVAQCGIADGCVIGMTTCDHLVQLQRAQAEYTRTVCRIDLQICSRHRGAANVVDHHTVLGTKAQHETCTPTQTLDLYIARVYAVVQHDS